MTNSTETKQKQKPSKGPVRTGVVVPLIVIVLLVGGYTKFLLDSHLRSAIEFVGTKINGAEVNVGNVRTSFIGASFEMNDTEITDKNKPARNLFTIGKIRFQFMWDALLRAKFVVSDASILDISALKPRKHPGYVVPPAPPEKGPSKIEAVEKEVLNQAESQYQDNILGDIAALLGGDSTTDTLKNIEGQLKSSGRLKELETELKVKQAEWDKRLKSMPQAKEIKEMGNQLKGLKFDPKNPVEFANSLKTAEKVLKEADKKIKAVKEAGKALNEDVDKYGDAFKEIEKMVDQDLKDLQSRMKIPDIDAAEFSKSLFMKKFSERLGNLRKYTAVAKQYMPEKKTKEEKAAEKAAQVIPPPRGAGHNHRFPVTTGYPLFWLKHAAIDSKASSSAEYSGNISGRLDDVTTDPHIVGKPTVLELAGDFPKQQIGGVNLKVTMDHTGETGKENVKLKIASYPVGDQQLLSSKEVSLGLKQATGGLDMNADINGEGVGVQITNAFTELKYEIEAKNKIIKQVLDKIMNSIPVIDVKASATGNWSKLDLHISSNLGEELSKGFKAEVQARIDEMKKKLKAQIDGQLGNQKEKLSSEFNKVKSQVNGEVSKTEAEIDNAKKSAQADIDQQKKNSGTKKLEEEGKKLLKKFKFGK